MSQASQQVRLSAWVHGLVQGVGFRWWTRSRALELGLTGHATNARDGRVHVVAEGPRAACERLLELLRGGETPGRVTLVVENWEPARGDLNGFEER
ncbi:acylphosphatase [Nocardia cyriacigeorgica]|jgi:acylphosphatase|uniref:acylphosphatase n=1 Tax=Nocardia cyriacigeorgica TaxID=135487 RepID=A0A2L2JSP8_9NOCA|nr:acylphosphatase [Nocardia cyriacigeorgica]AVH22883.1 acylphosphatase [Nocardia cyriacigeorgica]MBF6415665.1 acylphosphatase [Nocardia cyriacigeorgica]PPJ16587.1 acylphosphatase [Nocardia cyriacigeorgica]TLF61187.1 acylphosphatase [Nocardia cyriacigeorgica]VFA98807.1 Acylphosphatase [Nocardia cyriacigeorgica]